MRIEQKKTVHAKAIADFKKIQSAMYFERKQCLEDRRFYTIAGAQWEGPFGQGTDGRVHYEINMIQNSVTRIINEYKNNSIGVRFDSKDDQSDSTSSDNLTSIFRAMRNSTKTIEALDNAFEEAVGGGFGAFRLKAEYRNDSIDDERQDIIIEPITDADSCVYFDLDSKFMSKEDATYCFVLYSITHDKFEEMFDKRPASIQKHVQESYFDWVSSDSIYIAEYYLVEEIKDNVLYYANAFGTEKRELESNKDECEELEALGFHLNRKRSIKSRKIHKYIIDGNEILEDCGYIAGTNIPIIPVYGKRWFIDNVERCSGQVRLAKDPQRLLNTQVSKLGEIADLSQQEKPIFCPEQINGHQEWWATANYSNYPYLTINQLKDQNGNLQGVGPVAYTRPPSIPPALATLIDISNTFIKDVLGTQQIAEQISQNLSGNAIELLQNKIDIQSAGYINNLGNSIKRAAEVWLGMAREVYDEDDRKLKGETSSGGSTMISINEPKIKPDGATIIQNSFSDPMDVVVEIGPPTNSKRTSIVNNLMKFLPVVTDPETQQVLTSVIFNNIEGDGLQEVRDFFRYKLIKMGVLTPTKEENKKLATELANKQPDPNAAFLISSAKQAEALAQKAQADSILSVSKAKESEAKTTEILAGLDANKRQEILDLVEHIRKNQV